MNLKSMAPKTGSTTSPAVIRLCKRLVANSNPIYLNVEPYAGAEINECTENVNRVIGAKGGSIQYGWQIWEMQRMVEAEFHAVWIDPTGKLCDITPKGLSNISQILFLPDPSINYVGRQIDNVRIPVDDNDALIKKFIKINERYFEAVNKGDLADQYGAIAATPEIVAVMRELDDVSLELLQDEAKSEKKLTFARISKNAPCHCGSGKQYKRCHGKG